MPAHWKLEAFPGPRPVSSILRHAFKLLCIISFGEPDLVKVWEIAAREDETAWLENRDRISNRISNTVVVDGLLLGSLAAFVTTPPPVPHLLDYNEPGPYICLCISFGITLGCVIVGSSVVFGVSKCTPLWFRETLMASRSRICCTLIMMGYPFVYTGVATLVLAFGLLVAAWASQDRVLRGASTLLLILPGSMGFVYVWILIGRLWRTLQETAGYGSEKSAEELSKSAAHVNIHQQPTV